MTRVALKNPRLTLDAVRKLVHKHKAEWSKLPAAYELRYGPDRGLEAVSQLAWTYYCGHLSVTDILDFYNCTGSHSIARKFCYPLGLTVEQLDALMKILGIRRWKRKPQGTGIKLCRQPR